MAFLLKEKNCSIINVITFQCFYSCYFVLSDKTIVSTNASPAFATTGLLVATNWQNVALGHEGCIKTSRKLNLTQRRYDATLKTQYTILCDVAPLREINNFL